MTQIERIKRILRTIGRGNLVSTKELSSRINIPNPSIRRITSSLVKSNQIDRIEKGLFSIRNIKRREDVVEQQQEELLDEETEFHRKFIGTAKYQNEPRQWFAVTFETNDIDRESELLDALKQHLNDSFVDATGDTGYSDQVTETIDTRFIYDSIQVGEL